MRGALMRPAALVAGAVLLWSSADAQTLRQRVASLREGRLHLSLAARPGVCSNGGGSSFTMVDQGDDESREWESGCARGPIRVSLLVRQGRLVDARTYVGGRWRTDATAIDLGMLPAAATALELLGLVDQSHGESEALITAAALADSATVWPELLRLARRDDLPADTRTRAVFWLGQAAGAAAVRGLDTLANEPAEELEIRKQAVFALSQRASSEGVPVLVRIARTSPRPEIRKSALFWLGQSDDPRALELFEEILR